MARTPAPASIDVADESLTIRGARTTDAAAVWRLVSDSESLDGNSCYAYLLLCSDFADTCLTAYDGDQLAGFVAAYVPPKRPDVLFVWQIGVDRSYRGRGLGRRLLSQLIEQAPAAVRYVEATITPSNDASHRLFASLAASRGWPLTTAPRFASEHFAEPHHESEQVVRIGPIKD